MLNQVNFEGYLTRFWEYRDLCYMRLANHRPGEDGKTFSDYVTVLIDPSLDFDLRHIQIGRLLRVSGRIVGRDIVEPLKMVVAKSHGDVELPGKLSTLVIRRPAVQVLATSVKLISDARSSRAKTDRKGEPARKKSELPAVPIEAGVDLAELTTDC
jgi:hypothetical protein